jgi:hypothetical protein
VRAEERAAAGDIAKVPLYRFASLGLVIEFAVPWASRTLFLVPGSTCVETLVAKGISRGRVWTASEVLDLLSAGVTRADAVKIGGTKVQFNGAATGAARERSAPREAQLQLPIGA